MKRIKIISGHYGSGKTEISLNLAIGSNNSDIKIIKKYPKKALIDLDIANPYFRSRECRTLLENNGVFLIANAYREDITADLPALSAETRIPLEDKKYAAVIDLGGDDYGARIINQYSRYLKAEDYDFWFVVNANRPETADTDRALDHLNRITMETGLRCSGLINNTHMLRKTKESDIMKGYDVCRKLSDATGIDLICNTYAPEITGELNGRFEKLYPIKLYMRPEWLDN